MLTAINYKDWYCKTCHPHTQPPASWFLWVFFFMMLYSFNYRRHKRKQTWFTGMSVLLLTWWCSTGYTGFVACCNSSSLRWRRRGGAVRLDDARGTDAPDLQCRWAAAGTGSRPPAQSRCTSDYKEKQKQDRGQWIKSRNNRSLA